MNKKISVVVTTVAVMTLGALVLSFDTRSVFARTPVNTSAGTSTLWIAQNVNCEETNNVAEANECLGIADSELNQAYQQLIKGVSGEERQKLITAEKAWIKYRDTNCAFRTHNFPLSTSMGRQFYSVCKTRITKERTMELRR